MLAWLSGHLLELKVQGCGAGAVSRSEPKPGRSHVQSRFVECLCIISCSEASWASHHAWTAGAHVSTEGLSLFWGGRGGTGTSGPETWFRHFDFQNSGRLTKSELRGAEPPGKEPLYMAICSSSAALSILRFEAPGRGEGAELAGSRKVFATDPAGLRLLAAGGPGDALAEGAERRGAAPRRAENGKTNIAAARSSLALRS